MMIQHPVHKVVHIYCYLDTFGQDQLGKVTLRQNIIITISFLYALITLIALQKEFLGKYFQSQVIIKLIQLAENYLTVVNK